MNNASHIEGKLYQHDLTIKVTGDNSKNPGTEFISGNIEIATDDAGINIVPVRFSYVTEFYPKSGKPNDTYKVLSEIIDVKHVEDKCYFLTTDGSRNDIDPFFRKTGYMTDIISDRNGPVVEEQIVSGCTCLEYDRLFSLRQSPLLKTGDRILYKNVGAYTMCLSPLFIRYLPVIYVKEDGRYDVIREKWTAKEYINKSILQ